MTKYFNYVDTDSQVPYYFLVSNRGAKWEPIRVTRYTKYMTSSEWQRLKTSARYAPLIMYGKPLELTKKEIDYICSSTEATKKLINLIYGRLYNDNL